MRHSRAAAAAARSSAGTVLSSRSRPTRAVTLPSVTSRTLSQAAGAQASLRLCPGHGSRVWRQMRRDDAIAEDAAAGPPYPPELIETMEDFDELRAYAAEDDGTLNVEEAFAFLGIGIDSSSDDDSD